MYDLCSHVLVSSCFGGMIDSIDKSCRQDFVLRYYVEKRRVEVSILSCAYKFRVTVSRVLYGWIHDAWYLLISWSIMLMYGVLKQHDPQSDFEANFIRRAICVCVAIICTTQGLLEKINRFECRI